MQTVENERNNSIIINGFICFSMRQLYKIKSEWTYKMTTG